MLKDYLLSKQNIFIIICLLFLFRILFLSNYAYAKNVGDLDVICLGYNHYIGLSQHPEFQMISQQDTSDVMSSYRKLQGVIYEYAVITSKALMVGRISSDNVGSEFLIGTENNGFFIINLDLKASMFQINGVESGLSKKEMFLHLYERYDLDENDVVLKLFNLDNEIITQHKEGKFSCPVIK